MSKYSLAQALIEQVEAAAVSEQLDRDDVLEALMTLAVQDMKRTRGTDYVRSYLQYEVDSLGSGGFFEIQKR